MIKRNQALDKPASLSTFRSIAILLNYFVGFLIVYPIIGVLLSQNSSQIDFEISSGVLNGIVIFTIVTTVWLAWPLLKHEKKQATKPINLKKILLTYIMMYVAVLVINVALSYITQSDTSQNQALIIEAMKLNPTYVILSAVIMAPVVEEIVFRGVLYRKIRNANRFYAAIVISAFSFGLMHVLQSALELNYADLVFIVVYIVLGLFFAKIYEETGKLSNAIMLHFINNAVGIVAILVTLGA